MTDSINIRNCNNAIFFSEITHDMFCDRRLPTHGMMKVCSGILKIETNTEHIEAHAGDYIFWHRNCIAAMKKMSDGDIPFRSIAILMDNKVLREFFSENLSGKRLPMDLHQIYSPGVSLPHNIKVDSLFISLQPYADQDINPDETTIREKQNGVYYHRNGIKVVPNITWTTPDSYGYSFCGIAKHSVIAVNCTGICGSPTSMYIWQKGYEEMIERLEPSCILRYGDIMPNEYGEISVYYPNDNLNYLRNGR